MKSYEFTVLPAPSRVGRFGRRRGDEAFSAALTEIMNEMGAAGWDFVGAEMLTSRVGRWPLGRLRTREVLVFRRGKGQEAELMQQMQQLLNQIQHQTVPQIARDPVELTVRPRRVAANPTPRPVRKLRPRLATGSPAHATAAE